MPEEPYKGIDCRKRIKRPRIKVRIAPTSRVLKPGELMALSAQGAPFECDPGCYMWTLSPAMGVLSPRFGTTVYYRAPEITKNTNCEWSVTISLFIGAYELDSERYTINTFDDGKRAYERLSNEHEIEHLPPHYTWPVPGLPPPPGGALSNHVRLHAPTYRYTCNAEFIDKGVWSTRDLFWSWRWAENRWVLIHPVSGGTFTGYIHAITYFNGLAAKRNGEIIDRRSRLAKEEGCCPLALYPPTPQPEEEVLPYY